MAFSTPIPPDTAIITDDGGVTGWALVDVATGGFLGFAPLPRASFSETGCSMSDGTIATTDNTSGAGNGVIGIYDADLNLISNVTVGNPSIENVYPIGLTTDRSTYFYVITANDLDQLTAHRLSKAGATLNTWALGFTSTSDPTACAITRDNTKLFFRIVSGGSSLIKQLDTGTGVVTEVANLGAQTVSWLGVDVDGNIYVNRSTATDPVIEKFNSSWVSQGTVAAGPTGYGLDVAHFSSFDDHVITWTQKNTSNGTPLTLTIGAYFLGVFQPLIADQPGYPVRIDRTVPVNMTLTNASIALDPFGPYTVGSVVLDVLKNGVSIVNGTPPTISGGTSYSDSVLSGWTTALTGGDTLTFVITSTSQAQQVLITVTGDTTTVVGGHPSQFSRFRKIRLSDLAIISTSPDVPTESNSNFITEGAELSNSCPLIVSGIPNGLGGGGGGGGGTTDDQDACPDDESGTPGLWSLEALELIWQPLPGRHRRNQ